MKHPYLYYGCTELNIEHQQLEDEGVEISAGVAAEFEALAALDLDHDPSLQPRVLALLGRTAHLPVRKDFAYQEPSGLKEIRAARPANRPMISFNLTAEQYSERVYGAWLGRCAGCLLGKPIEGLLARDVWPYLKESRRYPIRDYFDSSLPDYLKEKYTFTTGRGYIDEIDHMVEDDDTNYTVTDLAVYKIHGRHFQPEDVAMFWLENIPLYHLFTAERAVYRNFVEMVNPPASGGWRNPYREWIGAQIRADFWGYVAAGNPSLSAEFAWRDACISHVKNGIYGEMWAAAMISSAAVLASPRAIVEAGLAEIPQNCRLAADVHEVMNWYDRGMDVEAAQLRIHQRWDDSNSHHWCHTLSNAQIVVLGLLWGEGDFEKSICAAVQACFDTDCNGATVGSILGMMHGAAGVPEKWKKPLNDLLETGLSGYHLVRISDLARETVELAQALRI